MSTAAPSLTMPVARGPALRLGWAVRDGLAMTMRNLITIRRLPQLLVFATIQPLLFVLMFRYVFGGAIQVPGVDYVNYLMPGIFAQVVAFGAVQTAVGLAEDRRRGLLERLRSLPMARSAVLAGRTTADLVRNVFVVALMTGVGFAVGFRVETNGAKFLLGLLVLLAFGLSLSWLFALIGLSVANAETAQAASFPVLLPLVFASSAFVSTASMPGWLQAFAEHQPVTAVVDAVRALVLGGPWGADVLKSLAWTAGILAVAVPLAIRRYRQGSSGA
ncbi:MAG TPA: ABC transporter permease [Miltoncostaeaceae bacterium]|nr:ABC transporter permease [Miltoncostaeaceae bacterium]